MIITHSQFIAHAVEVGLMKLNGKADIALVNIRMHCQSHVQVVDEDKELMNETVRYGGHVARPVKTYRIMPYDSQGQAFTQ